MGVLFGICLVHYLNEWTQSIERSYQKERKEGPSQIDRKDNPSGQKMDLPKVEMVNKTEKKISFPQLDSFGTCGKGEKLSKDWLKKEFVEFVKVYNKRPVNDNIGGTKMVHQFAAWASVR